MSSNNFATVAQSTAIEINVVALSSANVEALLNAVKAFESANGDIVEQSKALREINPLLKGMFETAQGKTETILAQARVRLIEIRGKELTAKYMTIEEDVDVVRSMVAAKLQKEFPEEKKSSTPFGAKPKDVPAGMDREILSILTPEPPVGTPESVVKERGKSAAKVHALLIAREGFAQVKPEQTVAMLRWMHVEKRTTNRFQTQAQVWFTL